MATKLITTTGDIALKHTPASQHPALVYLAGLGERSRRPMRHALDVIAGLLTDGQADALTMPWTAIRFQHMALVRSRLAEHYKPASANRMLAALRGVLRAAWCLGEMDTDT